MTTHGVRTASTTVGLVVAATLAFAAPARADDRGWQLRVGTQVGPSFAALHGQAQEGWGVTAALDLRPYAPNGLGLIARPRLELGSPNLAGGELGAAVRGEVPLNDALTLVVGGAAGIGAALRFVIPSPGLSFTSLGGGGGGTPGEAYLVGGWFAEGTLELETRRGLSFGLALVHHGWVVDTHEEARTPIFSLSPRLTVGGRFAL